MLRNAFTQYLHFSRFNETESLIGLHLISINCGMSSDRSRIEQCQAGKTSSNLKKIILNLHQLAVEGKCENMVRCLLDNVKLEILCNELVAGKGVAY